MPKKARKTKKKKAIFKASAKAAAKITVKTSAKPKAKKEESFNKCMRCDKEFTSRDLLKRHLKMHAQALQEIRMLEEGFVPIESKIGLEFKGKNKIIIS
jgi:hypothetical protein